MEKCLSWTVVTSIAERKDWKLPLTIFPESNSEEEVSTRLKHVHNAVDLKKDATGIWNLLKFLTPDIFAKQGRAGITHHITDAD